VRPGEEPRWESLTGEEVVVQGQLAALTDRRAVDVE
jgi:hypothetical protein